MTVAEGRGGGGGGGGGGAGGDTCSPPPEFSFTSYMFILLLLEFWPSISKLYNVISYQSTVKDLYSFWEVILSNTSDVSSEDLN